LKDGLRDFRKPLSCNEVTQKDCGFQIRHQLDVIILDILDLRSFYPVAILYPNNSFYCISVPCNYSHFYLNILLILNVFLFINYLLQSAAITHCKR